MGKKAVCGNLLWGCCCKGECVKALELTQKRSREQKRAGVRLLGVGKKQVQHDPSGVEILARVVGRTSGGGDSLLNIYKPKARSWSRKCKI